MSDLGQHGMFGETIAAYAERRREERFPIIRTAKLMYDDTEMPCVLRDISNSALRVRIYDAIPMGSREMMLEFGDGDRHPVELVWQRDGHAGLRFPQFADLRALVGEKGPFRKRAIRIGVDLPSSVTVLGTRHEIRIEDISHQGARISCDHPLAIDQQLRIAVPSLGEVYAVVRWREQPHYGLAFLETFRFEEIAHMAGSLQAISRVWRRQHPRQEVVRPVTMQKRVVNG
ncbi:PilZ domain-containing protein [Croceicoccus marinus]|nr:PilZ domain-containing protein [Croceicoccus marinus]